MTQFSLAVLAAQTESIFAKKYADGLSKDLYWDPMYEDALNLVARIPKIAAYIYRRTYKNGEHLSGDSSLDWSANFAKMLGYESDIFYEMMRLYMTIHADLKVEMLRHMRRTWQAPPSTMLIFLSLLD